MVVDATPISFPPERVRVRLMPNHKRTILSIHWPDGGER
jgi:hypothetical protein